jgi:prepilin-type N-terminal cleavage/methylation domain-containing protein
MASVFGGKSANLPYIPAMKRSSQSAFTLVEMLTVMAIIAILTGLVIATAGYVQNKAARERATGEIQEMTTACESYKADFGGYPQSDYTDALDPRKDGNPISAPSGTKYKQASLTLYSALSGDNEPVNAPDGKPEKKGYIQFLPNRLNTIKDTAGNVTQVQNLQDPFGNSYGYSTAALKKELDYRQAVAKDPTTPRPTGGDLAGYNSTFDLWSTAGQTVDPPSPNTNKWVRNWGQ